MASHRYVVTDLLTDQVVGRPTLSGVSYSRRVSVAGTFSGVMAVTARNAELARLMFRRPLGLYAIRQTPAGSEYWWGGIIWQPVPGRDSRGATAVELAGASFESYPAYRRIWTDTSYDPVDRGAALRDLWTRMQATDRGNIGVDIGAETVGGDPWSGAWQGYDGTTYVDAMQQVTTAEPAFEWTVDVYGDPVTGGRRRRLRVGGPVLGDQTARHYLTRPTTLQSWRIGVDHGQRPTHALARGATAARNIGSDTVPITSPIEVDPRAAQLGQLRVDGQADFGDISDETLLPGKARDLIPAGPAEPAVTVTIPDGSTWSPASIGDTARIRLDDPFFDDGRYSVVRRIIGCTVTPAERGRPETVAVEYQPETDTGAYG